MDNIDLLHGSTRQICNTVLNYVTKSIFQNPRNKVILKNLVQNKLCLIAKIQIRYSTREPCQIDVNSTFGLQRIQNWQKTKISHRPAVHFLEQASIQFLLTVTLQPLND